MKSHYWIFVCCCLTTGEFSLLNNFNESRLFKKKLEMNENSTFAIAKIELGL